MRFKIDPEFQALLPPQTEDERRRLAIKIELEGCAEGALVVAQVAGEWLLIDGHNTVEICRAKGLRLSKPRVEKLPTRDAAIDWIVNHQLARRNLSDEWRSYFIGKRYLQERKPVGNPQLCTADAIGDSEGSTAEKIAAETGVSPRKVHRDAKFAAAVDALPPEEKAKVLSGQAGKTKAEVAADAPVLCQRCQRIGAVDDCSICKQIRESKARKPAGKKKGPRAPKSGQEKFNWREFDKAYGVVARAPGEIKLAYPGEERTPEFHACMRLLSEFRKTWEKWQKRLTKAKE